VPEANLLLNPLLSDFAGVERVCEKRVEIGFLPLIGVPRVIGRELPDDRKREVEQPPFLEREVDREPGFPWLRAALRVVEQLGFGRQVIEVVPLGLE
jgi:hypothetical protein